jgi:hypothetical protein
MTAINGNLDQLVIVRRLLQDAQRAEDRRKGKPVEEKSILDEMKEDQALISGEVPDSDLAASTPARPTSDVQVNLSELFTRLKAVQSQPANAAAQPAQAAVQQVAVQQTVLQELHLSYTELEPVEGLVRRSQTQAETDRYRFDFSDGTTFKITDKWSNRSTTVYGDPHVDVDDIQGHRAGDFQDLKGSDTQTTFMLKDGTRLTFTARDNGVIEAVDLFKDSEHLGGIGAASKQWDPKTGLFAARVDEHSAKAYTVPQGDTVYAGGDGNDWYTSDGKLLWGKTTGPVVTSRPAAVLQMEYRETISQQVSVQMVDAQA